MTKELSIKDEQDEGYITQEGWEDSPLPVPPSMEGHLQ